MDGYGYLVEVKHDGDITTRYGHNSAILVTEGQQVEQGTILALVGSTGNSTGPHCHYEVRIHGDAVDPTYFPEMIDHEQAQACFFDRGISD